MKLVHPSPLETLKKMYEAIGANSGLWVYILRRARIVYVSLCFALAITFHLTGPSAVAAESKDPEDFVARSMIESQKTLIDELRGRIDQTNTHIDNTDKQVLDLRDGISTLKGEFIGGSIALGLLQAIIGFVGPRAKS